MEILFIKIIEYFGKKIPATWVNIARNTFLDITAKKKWNNEVKSYVSNFLYDKISPTNEVTYVVIESTKDNGGFKPILWYDNTGLLLLDTSEASYDYE